MHIWITGASGMIGAACVRLALAQGHTVTAVIRPGGRTDLFPASDRLTVLPLGLEEYAAYAEKPSACDWFLHFAWSGTTGAARADEERQQANIAYTLDAVRLAARLGAQVFVGAGSQAEYGRTTEVLTPDTPTHPETAYGRAKLAAGKASREEAHTLGLRHVWLRILSVYGPGNVENSLVMAAIRGFRKGDPPAFTPGEQLWDYLYADDAARACLLAAERGRDGAVYVLGSGKERPLKDYLAVIRDVCAPGTELVLGGKPYPEGAVMRLCADISELTEDTGFVPEVGFRQGILRLAALAQDDRTLQDDREGGNTP